MKKITILVLSVIFVILSVSCTGETTTMPSETVDSNKVDLNETDSVTTADTTSDTVTEETTEAQSPAAEPAEIFSLTVPKENNRNMYETLTGKITDCEIIIEIIAPTDTYSLKNAHVSIEHSGDLYYPVPGSETVDLTSPDCVFTVKNVDGKETRYKVVLKYGENTIPVVCIDTKDGKDIVTKEYYVDATISIDTAGVDGWYLSEGFEDLEPTSMLIKGRGNSTWNWEKKPYKFKFDSKVSILGLEKSKKWVLLANYSDYSLMRNYITMESAKVLSNQLSPFSQYPVNLFVNGEYRGVYSIGEDHNVGTGRIELSDNNGLPDTSFLLEIGGYDEDEDILDKTVLYTSLVRWCSIESPEDDEITQEQADFIIDYINRTDAAVVALSNYEDYIDVDALIDWFIANELFYNLESCFNRSCFMTKEPGEKLKMGPLWDYDLAMGNLYNDFGRYDIWACLAQEYGYIYDNWMCYLMDDSTFRAKLRTRWDEVKDELLDTAIGLIDRMEETLSSSAEYNFTVWNILGTRVVAPQPKSIVNLKTYEDNVKYIRDFVTNRWNWMDNNI
ncbi:MAG: CotH kinase family protein [Clostridia bacterium]|nr:CotH kinase family protein [Clostridia bacterium]